MTGAVGPMNLIPWLVMQALGSLGFSEARPNPGHAAYHQKLVYHGFIGIIF